MSPLAQRLRNACEAHDRDEFDRALLLVQALERQIPPARTSTPMNCVRFGGCMCVVIQDRTHCVNWVNSKAAS